MNTTIVVILAAVFALVLAKQRPCVHITPMQEADGFRLLAFALFTEIFYLSLRTNIWLAIPVWAVSVAVFAFGALFWHRR